MAESINWAQRRADFVEMVVWPEIQNKLLLNALQIVRQESFLPANRRREAYKSTAIQLKDGSSMTDPKLTAQMIDHLGLTGRERVLEIGTATGFTAALLSTCSATVDTIEHQEELAKSAQRRLRALGYRNVSVHTGDGAFGLPDRAPFDAIIVTAAARSIPEILLEQVADGGRMVVPVGRDPAQQDLIVLHRNGANFLRKAVHEVMFHPLTSTAPGGWTQEQLQETKVTKWERLKKAAENKGKTEAELIGFLCTQFELPEDKIYDTVTRLTRMDIDILQGIIGDEFAASRHAL